MAKILKIRLSDVNERIPLTNEKGERVLEQLRKVEKSCLSGIFEIVSAHSRSLAEVRVAMDNAANVDAISLDTPEASVNFTEADMKLIEKGVELSAGLAPLRFTWNKCRQLFIQLEEKKYETI